MIGGMSFVETIAKTTADTGRELMRFAGVPQDKAGHSATGLIPICPLHPEHLAAIKNHMLNLSAHDRYLRFGFAATNEQVERYVDELKFERDEIYGIFNRVQPGTLHLASKEGGFHGRIGRRRMSSRSRVLPTGNSYSPATEKP
jgi:hypothetical protein